MSFMNRSMSVWMCSIFDIFSLPSAGSCPTARTTRSDGMFRSVSESVSSALTNSWSLSSTISETLPRTNWMPSSFAWS